MKVFDEETVPVKDDEGDSLGRMLLRRVTRRPLLLAAVVGVITIIVLAVLLQASSSHEKELEARVDELQEMYNLLKEKHQDVSDSLEKAVPVITSATVKEELGALSELVTQEYIYTNADKLESDETWIFGWTRPFSAKSIVITYDGTIKAGIDLSAAVVEVDEGAKVIKVVLPPSRITDHNIPVEDIVVLEVKDGLFNKVTQEDYSDLISYEKLAMEQKAIDRGLLEKADREARAAAKNFLSAFSGAGGYTVDVSTQE